MNDEQRLGLARQLTDEVLDAQLDHVKRNGNLRSWATGLLSDWLHSTTVLSFPTSPELTSTDGALTAIDNLLKIAKKAYAHRGGRTSNRYGNIEFVIYEDDETLVSRLKSERDKILKAAADALALLEPDERDES